MKFSAFSYFGAFAFSGKPPKGQAIFEAMRNSLGGNYSEENDGHQTARLYAQARMLANALYTLERAKNNANPRKARELLGELEIEWGLFPAADSTVAERCAALAARMLLPRGARRENVEDALSTLLGSDFVEYHEQPASPATGGGSGVGNFPNPGTPAKRIRILTGISTGLGAPKTVTFSALDGGDNPKLVVGEKLVVDPGGLIELVTVTAATASTFAATFNKPHDPSVVATGGYFPYWTSTQRRNLIELSSEAAADPEIRRQVSDILRRVLRGVSTWDIADNSGPFKVGVGKIGITTIGAI